MQRTPPKRQIIKTRPQQPYIIARVIVLLIIVAVVIWLVLEFAHGRAHAAIAGAIFIRPEAGTAQLR